MKTIAAGEFKQTCLALLDEVRETGHAVVITKRGKPVAQLAPLPRQTNASWLGSMSNRGRVLGDLLAPAADPEEWEVLRS